METPFHLLLSLCFSLLLSRHTILNRSPWKALQRWPTSSLWGYPMTRKCRPCASSPSLSSASSPRVGTWGGRADPAGLSSPHAQAPLPQPALSGGLRLLLSGHSQSDGRTPHRRQNHFLRARAPSSSSWPSSP